MDIGSKYWEDIRNILTSQSRLTSQTVPVPLYKSTLSWSSVSFSWRKLPRYRCNRYLQALFLMLSDHGKYHNIFRAFQLTLHLRIFYFVRNVKWLLWFACDWLANVNKHCVSFYPEINKRQITKLWQSDRWFLHRSVARKILNLRYVSFIKVK